MKTLNHIAIIMDGNGRWAKERNAPRSYGHKKGSEQVNKIVEYAFKRGVKVISLYALSCENFSRPQEELDNLFALLKKYFKKNLKTLIKNEIRLEVMGDISVLPEDLIEIITSAKEKTKSFDKNVLNIALNYGGRQEIVKAVKELVESGEEITDKNIQSHLYTANIGDPDLIIRTSGEIRLSNFLLYQSAYSEMYFTSVLWPDFNEEELDKAIESYNGRQRRFGGIKNA